ncbi:hypothetical protein CI610_02946 [invertebrate metagenome]|uniref:Uncharacterized protein n=1 Tax=invertebrate metagenome TaxID=1711999 RepID=A0A2H9T4I7_9ZZZZ
MSEFLTIANRVDNSQLNGVSSCKNSVKLVTQKMKTLEDEIQRLDDMIHETNNRSQNIQQQITKLAKGQEGKQKGKPSSNTEGKANDNNRSSTNGACNTISIGTSNYFSMLSCDDQESPIESVSNVDAPTTRHETIQQPVSRVTESRKLSNFAHPARDSLTNSGSVCSSTLAQPARQPRQNSTSVPTDASHKPGSGNPNANLRQIKVHCPSSVCHPTPISTQKLSDRFVGFTPVKQKRIKRYYIHGINKYTASESAMRDFLGDNGVKITFLRYFEKGYKKTASAQLNVLDSDSAILENPDFWPPGIYARPWMPRQVFWNEHNDRK